MAFTFDFLENNPLANYWANEHRRMAQDMERLKWGSKIEAESGESAASFRLSDNYDYASKVLSESPVSFVKNFPAENDELRKLNGLEPIAEAPAESESSWGDYMPNFGVTDGLTRWLEDNAVKLGVYVLAIVLILGGLIIIALSTETGREVAGVAVKAAAA